MGWILAVGFSIQAPPFDQHVGFEPQGSQMTELDHSESEQFARIAQQLLAEPAIDLTLQRVVELARDTVDGCDLAGVFLRRERGKTETPAWTDPLAQRLDDLQESLKEGPALDAIWPEDQCIIEDLHYETRWPRWAPLAADLGVRSVLSVRLATSDHVVGSLSLYARELHAFDQDAVVTAHIYASHASNAIAVSTEVAGLQTALQTRHSIGVAQGLLMQRYALSQEKAFEFLRRQSQETNVKLRDVAADVIRELHRA